MNNSGTGIPVISTRETRIWADAAIVVAMQARNPSAVASLLRLKSQLHGLIVEKQEVTTKSINLDEVDGLSDEDMVKLRQRLEREAAQENVIPPRKTG